MKDKQMEFLDSYQKKDSEVLNILVSICQISEFDGFCVISCHILEVMGFLSIVQGLYMAAEAKNNGISLDCGTWPRVYPTDFGIQENG